ncbi:hypothetical protein C8R47DRAFT_433269 [Mycena vitilis]|nr:hypothetical protein C8R47DRAFT_433269 [Mycena vitilis]
MLQAFRNLSNPARWRLCCVDASSASPPELVLHSKRASNLRARNPHARGMGTAPGIGGEDRCCRCHGIVRALLILTRTSIVRPSYDPAAFVISAVKALSLVLQGRHFLSARGPPVAVSEGRKYLSCARMHKPPLTYTRNTCSSRTSDSLSEMPPPPSVTHPSFTCACRRTGTRTQGRQAVRASRRGPAAISGLETLARRREGEAGEEWVLVQCGVGAFV